MSRPFPYSPVCLCGYDLAGLDGPPWTCPECARITQVWPPPANVVVVTRVEQWALGLWLTGLCLGSIAVPWLGHGEEEQLVSLMLCGSTGLGALVWSSLFSREARSLGFIRWTLYRLFWATWVVLLSLLIGFVLGALSSLLRDVLLNRF